MTAFVQRPGRTPVLTIALITTLWLSAGAADFGKNKVHYRHFSWQSYRVPHFDVYFSQDEGPLPTVASLEDILLMDFAL